MTLKHPGERYLSRDGLDRALSAGRTVEQWLGVRFEEDNRVLKWLSIEKNKVGQFVVCLCEVWDAGGPDSIDVYEFTGCDPDNPEGDEPGVDWPNERRK